MLQKRQEKKLELCYPPGAEHTYGVSISLLILPGLETRDLAGLRGLADRGCETVSAVLGCGSGSGCAKMLGLSCSGGASFSALFFSFSVSAGAGEKVRESHVKGLKELSLRARIVEWNVGFHLNAADVLAAGSRRPVQRRPI